MQIVKSSKKNCHAFRQNPDLESLWTADIITDALNILYEGMSEENNSTRALSFCIVIKNVRRILCSQNSYFLRENFSLFLTILFRCLYHM